MALPLLLLELSLYASCFVCGIVTAASITIVQGNFGGRCMLYGLVNYNVTAGLIGIESPSSPSLCYFVTTISVMAAVVCFPVTLFWLCTFCTGGEIRRERACMNLIIAVSGFFLFFLLITGCVVKIGRDSLCNSVIQSVPNITSCEEAQTRKWVSPIRGGRFYIGLHDAENMSLNQCESVAVSVESLLSDAKRMQMQCRERSEQLSMAATQLRVESAALREQCESAQLDMAHIRRQLDDLMDTKSAFEARERQARKLSSQEPDPRRWRYRCCCWRWVCTPAVSSVGVLPPHPSP
ncbi:transmembrane protein 179B-like [Anarhichas minor]|uniref:transmembrane protein 179B-like n=1 Tax=Anarhichas minor TaxID=65739 RepID=UPI003F74177B